MASAPKQWVILVGIDFYVEEKRRLKGAINDINLIQLHLTQNLHPHSLTTFIAIDHKDPAQKEPDGPESTWPTYANIANEFYRVTHAASPGDSVYFHYSGHGALSPTTTLEYSENFGSDAALVLFDRHNKNNVRYMRGIELAAHLDRMVQKGLKVTVVLDCCHAGGLSRGRTISVRGMPWDGEVASAHPPQYPTEPMSPLILAESANRDASTTQHWLIKPRGYTLVAACGANELAAECCAKNGQAHGALTYFLYRILFRASTRNVCIALGDIYKQVCAELHVALPQQHPLLLGNPTSVFLTAETLGGPLGSSCNVTDISSDGRIWLNIGLAQGACPGDQYEIYSFEKIGSRTMQDCAVYIIADVHAFKSLATQLLAPPNGVQVAKGWHATLRRTFRPKAQVALTPDVESRLINLVEQSQWVELVDSIDVVPESLPSFQVRITTQGHYAIYLDSTDEIQNLPLMLVSDEQTDQILLSVLEHLAKFASIERIGNEEVGPLILPHPERHISPKWVVREKEIGDFEICLESVSNAGKPAVESTFCVLDNEKVKIHVRNLTTRPLYLTVLDLRPLRAVSKLYPSSDRGYYKEIPPKSARFKGEIAFAMRMSIPESLKKKGQSEVDDVLKFFIGTGPTCMSFAALELPELGQRLSSDQGLLEFLEGRLNHPGELRGSSLGGNEQWTCRNLIVRTKLSMGDSEAVGSEAAVQC
jgi:hypothetical protein